MLEYRPSAAASDSAESVAFLPVWRRITLQLSITVAIGALVVGAFSYLEPQLSRQLQRATGMALVALPVLMWVALSVWPEYHFGRPRRRLIAVAVVASLTASSLGLPLVEQFFRVDQWLPLQSVAQRILGYTLTVGLLDTGLKFVVLRYVVYPQALRVRSDAVAYAFAAAVGYSAYLSLVQIWRLEPTPDFAALFVLGNTAAQLASALFIALGIIESYFSDAIPLVLPLNLVVAAFASGTVSALAAGVMSGPLSTQGSGDRPILGLAILLAAISLSLAAVYFLYSNSERREREAYLGSGVNDGV